MRKKWITLGLVCILLSLAVFALSFVLFHYLTDDGFTMVWQSEAGKPFVTEVVADLGVALLSGGIMSLLGGKIFFPKEQS